MEEIQQPPRWPSLRRHAVQDAVADGPGGAAAAERETRDADVELRPSAQRPVVVRLAHVYEAGETADDLAQPVTIDLTRYFRRPGLAITSAVETTLTANAAPAARLTWKTEVAAEDGAFTARTPSLPSLTLRPMEVRTFLRGFRTVPRFPCSPEPVAGAGAGARGCTGSPFSGAMFYDPTETQAVNVPGLYLLLECLASANAGSPAKTPLAKPRRLLRPRVDRTLPPIFCTDTANAFTSIESPGIPSSASQAGSLRGRHHTVKWRRRPLSTAIPSYCFIPTGGRGPSAVINIPSPAA